MVLLASYSRDASGKAFIPPYTLGARGRRRNPGNYVGLIFKLSNYICETSLSKNRSLKLNFSQLFERTIYFVVQEALFAFDSACISG